MMSDAGFRIRPLFGSTTASYNSSVEAYDAHLRRIAPRRRNDTWRFFALDFFHDGPIRRYRLSDDCRRFTFEIRPTWINICELDLGQWNARVAPWFRVEIDGLAMFRRQIQPIAGYGDPFRGSDEYIYAELDTLHPELSSLRRLYPRKRFHSLVIAVQPSPTFLTFIYQRLHVRPLAPQAWSRLQRNRKLRMGLYRGPHDLRT
jgi:hypothetical protein